MIDETPRPWRRHRIRFALYGLLALSIVGAVLAYRYPLAIARLVMQGEWRRRSVEEVVATREADVRARYEPLLRARGLAWPPPTLTLVAMKEERTLEVWTAGVNGAPFRLARWPFTATSGGIGPKRKAGDGQIPEGIYPLDGLNPNSLFHLSVRVGYPNDDDRARAAARGDDPGGDIFVHGGAASIGCIAIGDAAIDELFVLAALVPARARRIVIAPWDTRGGRVLPRVDERWLAKRYVELAASLGELSER